MSKPYTHEITYNLMILNSTLTKVGEHSFSFSIYTSEHLSKTLDTAIKLRVR